MSAETEIRAALLKLDAKNDDHWTEDGLPRVDALGLPKGIGRQAVTAAAPLFTRANMVVDEQPKAAPAETIAAEPEKAPLVQGTVPAGFVPPREAKPSEEQLAELEAELAAMQEVVDSHRASLAAKQSELDAAQKRLDALIVLKEKHTDRRHENMLGIRAVLERGKVERAAKAELANELRKVGVTAKLLQGKSPLDQAMARKTGHGMNRPNFSARG